MLVKVSAGADTHEKSYVQVKKDVIIKNIALSRVVGARANFHMFSKDTSDVFKGISCP